MPTVRKIVRPWMKKGKAPEARWSNQLPAGLPKSFYRNAPWRKLRQRQLDKQPLCEECLTNKRLTPATVIDHIKPIRLGGEPLDETNVRSLCTSCHNAKSATERNKPSTYR